MICAIGLVWLGIYPQTFLDVSHSSMQWLVNSYVPVQEVVETVQQTATQLDHVEINNHELHSIIFYAYAFSTGDDCCFDGSRRHAVNFN